MTTQAKMLEGVSEGDIKRFAICFLLSDRSTINWEAAAVAYDPDVKIASFRTVTSKAANKVHKPEAAPASAEGEGGGTPVAVGAKKKATPRKRKVTTAAAADGVDESESPKKKTTAAKAKGKKAKSEEKIAEDEDNRVDSPLVKAEPPADVDANTATTAADEGGDELS